MILTRNSLNLQSTWSTVLAVFGGLLLFVALHCNNFVLSVLLPVRVMAVVSFRAMLVMFVGPRYQLITGTALLFTTHRTSLWVPSLIASGLSLGIKETLWTSTVNQFILKIKDIMLVSTKSNDIAKTKHMIF